MPDTTGPADMTTVGEALVQILEMHGVETVFGIPGVHTVELYRGLAASTIRHVTPRHEQGAGFMADGHARASGRPGVAFVITGPGLTNTITAMAQARADSVPMLVVSGVNQSATLGKGLGFLHELPDQRAMMATFALAATRIEGPAELQPAIERAFALFASARPGPVHIEIPLDVMGLPAAPIKRIAEPAEPPVPDETAIAAAARAIGQSIRPVILAGGGAKRAGPQLLALAERLDAPVVQTTNARGLMHSHPLCVPASPSLKSIAAMVAGSDLVIAVGTEFGQTDYDMYADGRFAVPANLIRIDIDAEQLDRHPAGIRVEADAAAGLDAIMSRISDRARATGTSNGIERAEAARTAALAEIGAEPRAQLAVVETIRDAVPGAIIVGDSTQPVYAANLYYDHDRPGGWFNAATGYGALGYGPPAAIGAALAAPDAIVVSLSGDGGFQFTLPELAAAVETKVNVIFIVWNNRGYREIETSMRDVGVEPVGVSPAPPKFDRIAQAYDLPYERVDDREGLAAALRRVAGFGPSLIEFVVP